MPGADSMDGRPEAFTAPAGTSGRAARRPLEDRILRFRKSERLLHWAIAIPFLLCYTTAFILVTVYNPHPLRPYRAVFSWTHRISAICFILFPVLAVIRSRGDFRIHFYNILQAWKWVADDLKWLALMGLAAVSSRITLPEQGKFNAAQKMNFMVLMGTYPLYIVTGLLVWLPGVAFLPWVLHVSMAVIATPLITGHIYMAAINPSSRKGLEGMISGFVDRHWARHHHSRWYREQWEGSGKPGRAAGRPSPAALKCGACGERRPVESWQALTGLAFDKQPRECPACGVKTDVVSVVVEPRLAGAIDLPAILQHLEAGPGRGGGPPDLRLQKR